MTIKLLLFIFHISYAGGDYQPDLIQSLNALSERSIITNYFLSNPNSVKCGKSKTYQHLGQRLALMVEDFKTTWSNYKPNKNEERTIIKLAKKCHLFDHCFSLKTLQESSSLINIQLNKKELLPNYNLQIEKIKQVCKKLNF